ncbi:MAG: NfeD family protein [Leptospiraceae bacterium]|nr:NfeD family protein [Leptospiraceae bacterium]
MIFPGVGQRWDMFYLEPETAGMIWMGLGVVLIISEFGIPGAVVIFLGMGAILTGGLAYVGLLPSLEMQFLFWAVSSLIFVILLRNQVKRLFPALERYSPANEDDIAIGRTVDVLKDVQPHNEDGRVRYQGTSWRARSLDRMIPTGDRAKIAGRENLLLLVTRDQSFPEQSDGNSQQENSFG